MINAPFGDCKTTELNLADSIQPFGAMLVLDARGRICAVSANSAEWLDETPQELLGKDAGKVLPPEVVDVRPAMGQASGFYLHPFVYKGRELQAATHGVGEHIVVEIESCPVSSLRSGREEAMLARGLKELGATHSVQAAAEALMRLVAEITGYDRVMLYQFLPEWHGKVVAEVCQPGVEGFLGLHFPAGDIPPNARRLYLVKHQRVIADVNAETVPVLSASAGTKVDLTYSQLRAVHPVHIQYLKNMGVEASFSVSLVVAGRLWGMIACHHFAPRQVPFSSRQLCEHLAGMASIHMGDLQRLASEQARHLHREALTYAKLELQALAGGKQGIATQLARIREAFAASGAWTFLDGHSHFSGDVPGSDSLALLKNRLDDFDRRKVFAFDRIDPALKKDAALVRFASGFLYVPLTGQDFVLLMRAEQVENVAWAGKPQSDAGGAGQQSDLTPRNSFQMWREETHGKAIPWQDSDLEAAELLRDLLTEHIERMRLERLALTDPLTGLANRAMFERKMQEAIRISLRDGVQSAAYMIDLDRFKPVNDRYGHAAGDALLVEVAQRLRAQAHDRDVVARLGGDEFAILQFRVAGSEEVEARAAGVLAALGKPYAVQGQMIEIGASIGVALCPQHAAEQHELLERADLALYKAKHEGRNGFRLFDASLLPQSGSRSQSRRSELAGAIERGALHFVYQPILHAHTRKLLGLEAFARWQHPEHGLLEGGELLMLAEQHGLLKPLALWELLQMVRQARQWREAGLTLVPLSINLSVQQFRSVDLAACCAELAKQHELGLEWLRLEVDGSILQSGATTTATRIAALASQGVLTRIDHFGSSLLPLAELAKLRIDCVKAHGSMLQKLPGTESAASLGTVLCAISKALQVPLVATRIETEAMLADAVGCGCDAVQGFAVAPLLKAMEVPAWLKQGGEG